MRNFLILCAFLFTYSVLIADMESSPRYKVCLNMIVKNESKVIRRSMGAVLPLIDYWVIVDTGSTDGTQEIIREFMAEKGVPGELHERPWKNFAHNRNEALELAMPKAEYILFIDADEYFVYEDGFKMPNLDKDFYYMTYKHDSISYHRVQLIKTSLDWKWVGVLHEAITTTQPATSGVLEKIYNVYTYDGARASNPNKFSDDAKVLEAALLEEPNNSRYVFYLAQSYKDAWMNDKALENYQKRSTMGGWPEEVFMSLLNIGKMQERLGMQPNVFIKSYMRAFEYRPSRSEPLYYIATYFRKNQNYEEAYKVASLGKNIPPSKDSLFVEHYVTDYLLPTELAISAYWVGKYDEAKEVCEKLLAKENIPNNYRESLEKTLFYTMTKLDEMGEAHVANESLANR